jgi:hypothetical protein
MRNVPPSMRIVGVVGDGELTLRAYAPRDDGGREARSRSLDQAVP